MKPEVVLLPLLLPFPLPLILPEVDFLLEDADIDTRVDFLQFSSKEFVCSSELFSLPSSVDELFSSPHLMVCADIELVNLSKFVVLFLRYLIACLGLFFDPLPASLKLLLFEIDVWVVSEAYLFCSSKISWRWDLLNRPRRTASEWLRTSVSIAANSLSILLMRTKSNSGADWGFSSEFKKFVCLFSLFWDSASNSDSCSARADSKRLTCMLRLKHRPKTRSQSMPKNWTLGSRSKPSLSSRSESSDSKSNFHWRSGNLK